jgi:integrase
MATVTKRKWTTAKGEAREAWVLAYTDNSGGRHKIQFAKKRDADAKRIEVEGQVSKGTFRPEASKTTVSEAVDLYINHLETREKRGERVKLHYLKTTESQLRNYVAPKPGRAIDFQHGLGHVKLAQLTASAVGDFRDALRESGVSVITTRRILGSLSRTLKFAVSKDLVAMNVAQGVTVIGRRDEGSRKVVPPSKAAVGAALKKADGDFALKIKFAAASGLRASELHALRWRQIDFVAREVAVDTAVDAYGMVDTTKSHAGVRRIPLASSILVSLKEWRLKTKFASDDDLVFPNTRGGHVAHKNMLRRQFRPLIEALAADNKKFKIFGWHGLRHFAISTWIEAGLAPKTIQTFAGHSSLAVTMSRYGHMFPSDDHASAMNKIADELFA